MNPLPPPDQHRLRAAEGWLELGCDKDALTELDQIDSQFIEHPDVLHLRWQIHRKGAQWPECLRVAQVFADIAPKDPRAWTSLAQTFYYTKQVQEAYDLAVSKITAFPAYWPLYYDAACYACLTGRLPQARQFLQLAATLGDEAEVKLLAAQDPDLEMLRNERPEH